MIPLNLDMMINMRQSFVAWLVISGSLALAPGAPRSSRPAMEAAADPAAKANAQSLSRRPSGRTPTFTSQDLTNLVKNELAPNPKPWLPPQLSFRADFPKTAAAVNELKGSVKASVADLKKTVEKTVEAVPIYRSIQSKARRARNKVVEERRPTSPSRAPGLTSQDVAALVEGRPPTNEST